MTLCVVIPCLNEEKYIGTLLHDLSMQTLYPDMVVVADAGSKDRTSEVIQFHKRKLNIKTVKGGLPAVGRNLGAMVCPSDSLIFFLDADVSVERNFLSRASKEMQRKKLECAGCTNHPFYRQWEKGYNSWAIRVFDDLLYTVINNGIKLLKTVRVPGAIGTCIIVSKRAFDGVDGFDESVDAFEDGLFIREVAKKYRYGVLNSVKVNVSTRRYDRKGRARYISEMLYNGILIWGLRVKKRMGYFD
ncbi:MAG: glycosyltransferase [Candidatus Woesearchaeota archaeon]